MKCVYMQYYCVVTKCTIHAPRTTGIHGRTDFKFESLLYIIETKCVSLGLKLRDKMFQSHHHR